MTADKIN